jgi:hypothetical protein
MIALSRVAMLAACLAGLPSAVLAGSAPIESRVITTFKIGSDETRFGPLEFIGGLEMVSSNRIFGSWSSIKVDPDGKRIAGVLDTGHWLTGSLVRDAQGRLSGLADVDINPMQDESGRSFEGKGRMDAEGLALDKDRALVSFEGNHRVDIYPRQGFAASAAVGTLPILIPRDELRGNRSLETVAIAPTESALKGAAVIVSEESLDDDGNVYAAILEGPLKGRFAVSRSDDFDPTDGAFLPAGDLLLLERRFNMADGIGMRIRRIAAAEIRPGAVATGKVLMTADFGYQIDNMEGLGAFQAEDGSTHIILVSDDNHSILQRNMMLEFRLLD